MERPVATTPYFNREIVVSFLMPVTLAMQIATGGQPANIYNKLRYAVGMAPAGYYRPGDDDAQPASQQNATNDDISRILNILKPSVSGLAKYLRVSRTAIYDWMNGKQISAINAAKLENFTKAADVIAAANLQMSPVVRGRKLPNGLILFEIYLCWCRWCKRGNGACSYAPWRGRSP